jgi:hypothetical protein
VVGDDSRERLLEHARAVRELPEPDRRNAILGIIKERYAQTWEAFFRGDRPEIPCSIEDVILCAYETTDRFWRGCLHDAWPHATIIDLLAITAATSGLDEQRRRRLLDLVLVRYPGAVNTVPAAGVARWLAQHPDAEELVHPTLAAYLDPAAQRSDNPSPDEPAPCIEDKRVDEAPFQANPERGSTKKTPPTPADLVVAYLASTSEPSARGLKRYRFALHLSRDRAYDWKTLERLVPAGTFKGIGGRGHRG